LDKAKKSKVEKIDQELSKLVTLLQNEKTYGGA
jgi:hypothetical protein